MIYACIITEESSAVYGVQSVWSSHLQRLHRQVYMVLAEVRIFYLRLYSH